MKRRGAVAAAVGLAWALASGTPALAADSPLRPDWHVSKHPAGLRDRIAFFAGGDLARDSAFAWSGVIAASAGKLHENGFRFRLMAGKGRYRYRTLAVATGVNRGEVTSGEMLFGFRQAIGATIVTALVGGHIESQKLEAPDPGHRAQGTAGGAKAAIEVHHRFRDDLHATASASATTVHRGYHARAALAYDHPGGFSVGYEAAINGDARYREPRAGLFLQRTYGRTVFQLSGGYLSNSDKGRGPYTTLSVYAPY
jgi:hypothetical protein